MKNITNINIEIESEAQLTEAIRQQIIEEIAMSLDSGGEVDLYDITDQNVLNHYVSYREDE